MENESNKQIEIKLLDLWDILKRCWILMLAAMILVSGIAMIVTVKNHEKVYTSTVDIWAWRNNEGTGSDYQNQQQDSIGADLSQKLISDYKVMLTHRVVLERVCKKDRNALTEKELLSMMRVSHDDETRIIQLSITNGDAGRAQKLATLWASEFCDWVNVELMNGQEVVQPLTEEATLPTVESNPISNSYIKVLLFGFVSAILVYAVYFVLFLMDDKINTPADVEKYLDLHLLGAIPNKNQLNRKRSKYSYYYNRSKNQ